jgi:lipooligosaccharide transport system permease protein
MASTSTTTPRATGTAATPVPGRWARALHVAEVEARRYRRAWRGSVTSAFLTPLLYLGAMGLGLGTLVDRGAGQASLDGVSYAAFLAPGMLAASAMQTAAMQGAWPVMAGIKWRKTYHAALATPVEVDDLLLGNTMWIVVRLLMAAGAFGAVMVVLGLGSVGGVLLALPAAVLAGLSFGVPMAAFTATVENLAHLSTVFRFGVIPMFLLSGTFFPVEQLPASVEVVARVLPLYHAVELARAATLGTPLIAPVAVHVAVPLAYALAGALVARHTFARRLAS